jgi:hypothetical protein
MAKTITLTTSDNLKTQSLNQMAIFLWQLKALKVDKTRLVHQLSHSTIC